MKCFLAILFCLTIFSMAGTAQDTGGFGSFEVTVLDAEGEPLPDATVNVVAGALEFPLTVDKDGFGMLNLPNDAKTLTLLASCPGHIPLEIRWRDKIPANFTFKMSKGQPIGGIIHDEHGRPIAGVQVEGLVVSSRASADGEVRPLVGGELGTTDSAGKWQADIATDEPLELRLKLTHDKYFSDVSYGKRRVSNDELRGLKHIEVMADLLPPQGTIRDSEGKPVADVAVYLIKDDEKITLENGQVVGKVAAVNHSSAQGKFEIANPKTGFDLLFVSDEGWEMMPGKPFAKNLPVDVTLTPWARVEGVLTEGDQPGTIQELQLLILGSETRSGGSHVIWNNITETNDKGEFVFERLINGHAILGARFPYCAETEHERQDFSNEAQCSVPPGKTTKVQMSRAGLEVTGMVIPLRYDETEAVIACGMIKLEKEDGPADIARNIFFEWGRASTVGMQFDPVKQAAMLQDPPPTSYAAKVDSDGTFHLYHVPPGNYKARVSLWCEATDEEPAAWHSGYIWEDTPIEAAADAKDKPVDLGLLEIEVYASEEE